MKLQKDTKLWWFCAPKASGNCGCSYKFSIRQSQKWIDHLQKKDEKIVYLFFERKNCVNFNKKVESRSTQWGEEEDFSSLIEIVLYFIHLSFSQCRKQFLGEAEKQPQVQKNVFVTGKMTNVMEYITFFDFAAYTTSSCTMRCH